MTCPGLRRHEGTPGFPVGDTELLTAELETGQDSEWSQAAVTPSG